MDFGTKFLIFIFIVFFFFAFFLKFLIDYRKKSLLENLRLTSSDAWNSIKSHATYRKDSPSFDQAPEDIKHWYRKLFNYSPPYLERRGYISKGRK